MLTDSPAAPHVANLARDNRHILRPRPLTVDAAHLAKLLGVGVRSIRTWDYSGKIPRPLALGGRRVWYLPEVRSWLANGAPSREEWEARKAARRNARHR